MKKKKLQMMLILMVFKLLVLKNIKEIIIQKKNIGIKKKIIIKMMKKK